MTKQTTIMTANTLDGQTLLVELSDGSTIKLSLTQMLSLRPEIIGENEGLQDGPPPREQKIQ